MKEFKKVEIIISEGHNYNDSVKNGAPFISVDYNASTYGGASPCDSGEEIQTAIKNAKKTIREHRNIPVVMDTRKKATLNHWF